MTTYGLLSEYLEQVKGRIPDISLGNSGFYMGKALYHLGHAIVRAHIDGQINIWREKIKLQLDEQALSLGEDHEVIVLLRKMYDLALSDSACDANEARVHEATPPPKPLVNPERKAVVQGDTDAEIRIPPSSMPQSLPVEDASVFQARISAHRARMMAAGGEHAAFLRMHLEDEMLSVLTPLAAEKMRLTRADGDEHSVMIAKSGICYVVWTIPADIHQAANWFDCRHGGYTKVLEACWNSDTYRNFDCQVLCHITVGVTPGEGWTNISVCPIRSRTFSFRPIIATDLLSPAERRQHGIPTACNDEEEEQRKRKDEEAGRLRSAEEQRHKEEKAQREKLRIEEKRCDEEARKRKDDEAAKLRAAEEQHRREEEARLRDGRRAKAIILTVLFGAFLNFVGYLYYTGGDRTMGMQFFIYGSLVTLTIIVTIVLWPKK